MAELARLAEDAAAADRASAGVDVVDSEPRPQPVAAQSKAPATMPIMMPQATRTTHSARRAMRPRRATIERRMNMVRRAKDTCDGEGAAGWTAPL